MEEAFEKLKKEGKTDVDGLIKWMKDSKVIGDAKADDDKARALLNEAEDKKSVGLAKFKEVLAKLAADQKKNLEDFTKVLAAKGPEVLSQAAAAGASALKNAFK